MIGNAVKYATQTQVYIEQRRGEVHIIVSDNGPGIPEAQLEKVFAAFYRVDSARTASKGGTGLGLAITQDIIHTHKGKIQLSNKPEGGLMVSIALMI